MPQLSLFIAEVDHARETKDVVEEWLPFPGAPGNRVSNLGRFQSPAGRLMAGSLNWTGYVHVGPCVDGKQRFFLAHRIVALAFIPKRDGCEIVNHKDRDRQNNRASNLEWGTYSTNAKHWRRERRLTREAG